MKFVKTDREAAIKQIAHRINDELSKNPVLLLLSGGSNIQLGVAVVEKLSPTENLTVGLVDERYVPLGHRDSNWQQLLDAGLRADSLKTLPVLHDGLSAPETAQLYSDALTQARKQHSTVAGIFGMGADGHTSGVLPNSPAVTHTGDFISYQGPDFDRLTTTPAFFKHIDISFLVVFGANKSPMLEKLKTAAPAHEQPAQALKDSRELIVYNDQTS